MRGGGDSTHSIPYRFVSTCSCPRGYIPGACMLDVWKPGPGRFRELPAGVLFGSVYERLQHTMSTLSTVMIASYGHDPRHDLFLIGVACASTLLPYAVGITVTASLYNSTHHRSAIPQRTQRNIIEAYDEAITGAIGIY